MMGPDRFGNSSIEKAVITSTDSKKLDFYAKRLNNKMADCLTEEKIILINPDIVKYNKETIEYILIHPSSPAVNILFSSKLYLILVVSPL